MPQGEMSSARPVSPTTNAPPARNGGQLRNCDVIMKGGVTSGVVYPLALVELSREFQFKSIGGTSAGAIAAGLTAAAEYRRVEFGSIAGFDELAKLPQFLGETSDGQSNLFNLFPPAKPTRRLFAVATAFAGDGSRWLKSLRVVIAFLRAYPLCSLASFLPLFFVVALWLRGIFGARLTGWAAPVAVLFTLICGLLACAIMVLALARFLDSSAQRVWLLHRMQASRSESTRRYRVAVRRAAKNGRAVTEQSATDFR